MKNDINLLKHRKIAAGSGKKRSYVLFAILFAVILLAGIVLPLRSLSSAKLKLYALESELMMTTVTQESLNLTMGQVAQLRSQLSDLQTLHASRSDILSYLSAIERSLPHTAELAQLTFSGNVLSISGTAPDDTTLAVFLLQLRNSGAFSNVFLSNSTSPSGQTKQAMFTLTATLPVPLSGAALAAAAKEEKTDEAVRKDNGEEQP